jgi:hypothetical protein
VAQSQPASVQLTETQKYRILRTHRQAVRYSTVKLHLPGLFGMASQPDMREFRIIGFFFENRLNWQFEVEKILQTAVLNFIFTYKQIKH